MDLKRNEPAEMSAQREAMAGDLSRLGIPRLEDVAGQEPDQLHGAFRALDGVPYDPCVRDVFAAVAAYANGEEARPWWTFTPARKARDIRSGRTGKIGRAG